jgi:uncharacterized protein
VNHTPAASGADRSIGSTAAGSTDGNTDGASCAPPADSPLGRALAAERTWQGPDRAGVDSILAGARSIAVVGVSPNPERASNEVAAYLKALGTYRLYFVNPRAETILGERAYPDLASLPEVPDIVDVFRRASETPAVVDEAITVGAPTVWLQLGIWNEDAAATAESAGLTVVMDKCIKIEHSRWTREVARNAGAATAPTAPTG